jgi:AraC-like DNA-binding protein
MIELQWATEPSAAELEISRIERLREGFWLGVTAGTPLRLDAADTRAVLVACPLGGGRDPLRDSGRDRVFLSSAGTGPLAIPVDGSAVVLAMDVQLLRLILGADFDSLPHAALAVATGAGGEVRVIRSAEQILAACALRDCTHEGAVRNVYLKSRALELLALSFGALKRQERPSASDVMPSREAERMVRAREILLARVEDPPSLGELATLVGVCETRLKIGFKSTFGDTPFGFLRRYRMTLARELLLSGDVGVTEAASRVGYTNVSHFIDAFVRHHGVRPGELVRARRQPPTA